ncbi:MAG: hypothetical protein K1X67_24820 [Fimbriimonadaceae bacterium]|nr:hypothetical protein [Fimbriimonadaceae bacterium]
MDESRALALELARDLDPAPEHIRRIARATSSEAASWAFTQWQLRRVALRKFALANEMLFVREALEQATGEVLAAYRASRFVAAGAAGGDSTGLINEMTGTSRRLPSHATHSQEPEPMPRPPSPAPSQPQSAPDLAAEERGWGSGEGECTAVGEPPPQPSPTGVGEGAHDPMPPSSHGWRPPADAVEVADLTCGIGGDLIALARVGRATGFELDPERAECARHNLCVHGLEARVRVESCLDHLHEFRYAFADPARRVGGRRSTDIADFQPDPHMIAAAMRDMELGGIKLSPLLPDTVLASFGGRVEFLSFAGECREALVWLGRRAGEPGTYAVWTDGSRVEVLPSTDPPPHEDQAMAMIAEADPSAIRAHALGNFGCAALGDSNGYLTGDEIPPSVWLRRYEVLFDGPWRPKTIQAELQRLGAKVTSVKTRTKGAEVEEASKKLKPAGPKPVVLILYPVGPKVRAAITIPA